jgi:hypothetical protein
MMLPAPAISVIVPDCEWIEGLRVGLEGFVAQTVPSDQFELILAGPHLADHEESLRSQFGGRLQLVLGDADYADLATVRNAAIRKARAPLLVLYTAELQPLPELLEYCLNFHTARPALRDASLLGYAVGAMFQRIYSPPSTAGIQLWQAFRSEAITCKAAVFLHHQFRPAYRSMAGRELALRLSRSVDFRMFYEPVLTGTRIEDISLRAVCEAHYLAAFDDYLVACAYPGAASHSPSQRIDAEQLTAMVAAVRGMESKVAEPGSPRFKMLSALYSRIEEHARAEGWAAAQNAQAPNPPGSLGTLLK